LVAVVSGNVNSGVEESVLPNGTHLDCQVTDGEVQMPWHGLVKADKAAVGGSWGLGTPGVLSRTAGMTYV